MKSDLQFGLGLVSIGRVWGHVKRPIPSTAQVNHLLETAIGLGIRFFDTAAAYGASEERFGAFLRTLEPTQLPDVIIATKCGEHWDRQSATAYVDQSYDALCKSIDRSFKHLPRIDILQLHKATPKAVGSSDVRRAFEYAKSRGVKRFGASVSDMDTARIAIEDHQYSAIQFPYNRANSFMEEAFELAAKYNKRILINRPFGMGKLLYDDRGDLKEANVRTELYEYILRESFRGVVLTGASSVEHLRQDAQAFKEALASVGIE